MDENTLSKLPGPNKLSIDTIISELQGCHELVAIHGDTEQRTNQNITTDSRLASKSCAFIAYKGVTTDSHKFIPAVLSAGGLVICEKVPDSLPAGSLVIEVKNSRRTWAFLSSKQYDHPERDLEMIGITGTNGKSSTVWVLKELSDRLGIKSLSLGTLGAYMCDQFIETAHTTPDPDKFYQLLRYAKDQGVTHCYMEVSSIALAMEKVAPVKFSAVGFTSFSRDHLDYHPSLEEYFYEKSRLFSELSTEKTLKVISAGVKIPEGQNLDLTGAVRVYEGPNKVRDFINPPTDKALALEQTLANSTVKWGEDTCELSIAGDFIIENATCAKIILEKYIETSPREWPWHQLSPIPGRLEVVSTSPGVVVDYAHTPDALEKVLLTLRPLCKGRLITVFGCGGDRDKGKRPLMGEVSQRHSDFQVVTSDNPRTEDPSSIIEDITKAMKGEFKIITDREEAIEFAIETAEAQDIILIAGKGHEDYQIIGDTKTDFDDRLVAKKYL